MNDAGLIQNLIVTGCKTVSVIHSVAGAERSNHYHREDSHYLFVLRGEMHYWERPAGSEAEPTFTVVHEGEMIFTPAMVEHTVRFPMRTTLISMAALDRSHEAHEADVVRVKCLAP